MLAGERLADPLVTSIDWLERMRAARSDQVRFAAAMAPLDPPRDEDPSEGDWESEGGAPAPDSADE